MTLDHLITYALGPEEARHVDTAIPQPVFDAMTQTARADIAGWYYAPECRLFGRLLTRSECWREIRRRIEADQLRLGWIHATWAVDRVLDPLEATQLLAWPQFEWLVEHDWLLVLVPITR